MEVAHLYIDGQEKMKEALHSNLQELKSRRKKEYEGK